MNIPSIAGRFRSYSFPVPTITADISAEQNRYGTVAKKYWMPDLQKLRAMYQPDTMMGTILALQLVGS